MMSILFGILLIFGIVSLAMAPRSKDTVMLRLSLAATYLAIIALAANTYQSAIQADETGVSGATVGWIGGWWLPVLGLLLILAIVQHVVLARHRP